MSRSCAAASSGGTSSPPTARWWQWPPQPYQALEEEYPEDRAARSSSADDVVDLTPYLKPDGRLDWQFPAGRWTVLRFGWTPIAEPARMG